MSAAQPFFDIKDLRPHPPEYRPHFRSREVAFSTADWQVFGDALKKAYPAGRYIRSLSPQESRNEQAPDWQVTDHLCGYMEAPGRLPADIALCLEPDWRLEIKWRTDFSFARWSRNLIPLPFVKFRPGGYVIPEANGFPERLLDGRIDIYCECNNKEHFAFARRFYKLFSRYATNANQIAVRYPGYEVAAVIEKGSLIWFGADAIRWVRENPRRLLYFEQGGWGYRPR